MMKKILSVALASTMLLGTPVVGFAATPTETLIENIKNEDVAKAVSRLEAFGIVNGMEDGEYHPEIMVTREQFAKLVVESLGLGNAVDAAKGSTNFTDVSSSRWSSGYINVAVGQGIVKGMGDGTFAPAKEVSYAEAVTMLVRALGYKDEFIEGTWPGNYVAKAAELDITDDVNTSNGSADRGNVAIMVNNTLDANVIKITNYTNGNIEYSETDTSLLEDKLDANKVSNLRVVATSEMDSSLEKDEVKVMAIKKDVVIDGQDLDKYEQTTIDTKVDVEALLGEEITAYFDGEELVYVESETNSKNIYKALVKDDGTDYENVIIEGASSDEYGWDDEAVVYINNEDMKFANKNDDEDRNDVEKELDTDFVFARKVVVENGDIVFLDAVKFEEKYTNMVVKSVDLDKERINYFETFKGNDDDKDLKLDGYDFYDIYTEDGVKLELEDLEKDDLIYLVEEEDDNDRAHVIVAKDRTVTGDLENFRLGIANTGHDRGSVKIDGENYDFQDSFTFTEDDMENVELFNHESDLSDTLEDVFGEEVTVMRDLRGKIAFFSTSVEVSTDDYAVILGQNSKYGDTELKVWNMNGTVAYYTYDKGVELSELKNGTIIKYDLNSNGDKIEVLNVWEITEVAGEYFANGVALKTLDTKDTFEDDSVRIAGESKVYNNSDSVYLDYSEFLTSADEDDLDAITWEELQNNDADSNSQVLVVEDSEHREVEFMVFVNNADVVAADIYEGYIVSIERSKDTKTMVVDVVGEGTKTYVVDVDDDAYGKVEIETAIVFTEKGSSIKLVTGTKMDEYNFVNDDFDVNVTTGSAWFVDRDGKYVDVVVAEKQDDDTYMLVEKTLVISSDAVVYKDADEKDKSDLDFGYFINYVEKDGEIQVLKYKEDGDTVEGKTTLVEDGDGYVIQ